MMAAIARWLAAWVVVLSGVALRWEVDAVPTVPKGGEGAGYGEKEHAPEPDNRWFKKWRGERPGLEKGEKSFHAPRPLDFDMEAAFKTLPVTDQMLAQWELEEDQPVASFAYTVALALGGVATLPERAAPGFSSKVTVHAIGAAKYREARIEHTFSALCQVVKLNPALSDITEIDVVLVGPTLSLGPTKDAEPVVVEAAGCRTSVSIFSGGYSEEVLKEFPAPPDVVVGFDVDAYTCSWRKSLLYIVENQLPTVLSFMMPHESLWVEELLAHPGEAFGKPSKAECAEDLERQRKIEAKIEEKEKEAARTAGDSQGQKMKPGLHHTVARDELVALMKDGIADSLLDWTPVDSSFDISERIDVFVAPFARAPAIGNNPFGGKRVQRGVQRDGGMPLPPLKAGKDGDVDAKEADQGHEHDKNAIAIYGHPNSFLLGFLVVAATASDTTAIKAVPAENQRKASVMLQSTQARMKSEGRPVVSRWTAMDMNRAIREKLPGWTANRSVKHAMAHATKFITGAKGPQGHHAKEDKGFLGRLKDGLMGSSIDKKTKEAQQKLEEELIQEKAALTEVTGLLPKKHADFELFKKQMLPKMALKGGTKADATEAFNKMDKDGDGVLSKEEYSAATKMQRGHENR